MNKKLVSVCCGADVEPAVMKKNPRETIYECLNCGLWPCEIEEASATPEDQRFRDKVKQSAGTGGEK